MKLEITRLESEVSVLHITDLKEIDFTVSDEFRNHVVRVLDELEPPKIIVDFTPIEFFDSSGLGVFIMAYKHVQGKNGKLAICNARDEVKRIFKTTRLDTIFKLYDSIDEAHQALMN